MESLIKVQNADVFFVISQNNRRVFVISLYKLLNKQSICRWFQTPERWRDVIQFGQNDTMFQSFDDIISSTIFNLSDHF